jgi:putative ABC transport system permease protein
LAQPRFSAVVLMAFAALAIVLTAVGLYGSLSYYLSQRSREYAVRAALGAERSTLVRLALRHGVSPAVLGLAAGLVAARAVIPLTRAYLFDGGSAGLLPLATAALVVLPVAIGAAMVPALRIAKVDPSQLLRRT